MAYAAWSVVYGETPSATKWNILGTNDASFNNGTGFIAGVPVQVVSTSYADLATGTTVIPFDDSIPQITEGDQYMTQAITPKSASNKVLVLVSAMISNNAVGGNQLIGAIFRDAVANALATTLDYQATSTGVCQLNFSYLDSPATTSAVTYRFRAGGGGAGTTTFCGQNAGAKFGACPNSFITCIEVTG